MAQLRVKLLEKTGQNTISFSKSEADMVLDAFRKFESDRNIEEDAYTPPKVCAYIANALKDSIGNDNVYQEKHLFEDVSLTISMDASECFEPDYPFIIRIIIEDVNLKVSVRYDLNDDT